MTCWIIFVPSQMPRYSSILPSVFVNGAPRVLIAKTKSKPRGDNLKSPTLLPHARVQMGGSVLEA